MKRPHSNPRVPWSCSSPCSDPGPGGSQEMQEFRSQSRWGCSTPDSQEEQQSDSSGNHGTWVILNRTQGRMPKNFCFFPNPVQLLWITSYYISLSAHSVCPYKSRNWSTLWLLCAQRISEVLCGQFCSVLGKSFLNFSFKDKSALLYKAWDY